jgi:hypothetical protein
VKLSRFLGFCISRIEMMFSWLKYRRSFISRNVRRQNMEWSNGVIFLIATFWPEGLWIAELPRSAHIDRREEVSLPDNTISTFADYILDIILLGDVEGDFPRACSRLCAGHGEDVDSCLSSTKK